MNNFVLEIRNLSLHLGETCLIDGISLHISHGETVALVGESGSGKSLCAAAIGAILPYGISYTGEILVDGQSISSRGDSEILSLRHHKLGMIFQDPLATFDPVFTLGSTFIEVIRTIHKISHSAAYTMAYDLLAQVKIANPSLFLRKYSSEVSGGQLQRASIALALAHRPQLLIADEPTTALDAHIQAEILDLLRDIQAKYNLSILLITHDMGVVADLAETVYVMKTGKIIEAGEVEQVLLSPQHTYTQKLIAAANYLPMTLPQLGDTGEKVIPLIQVENATVTYKNKNTSYNAIDDINLTIYQGEILAIIGESGAGKSTLGRSLIGLANLTHGQIIYQGDPLKRSSGKIHGKKRREYGKKIGVVFQNPFSSLNPAHTISHNIALPLLIHSQLNAFERKKKINMLLEKVGLDPALAYLYPSQLSGGQLQRTAIARAIALDPELLILDEPTSALDVSTQEGILRLLQELHIQKNFTIILITHNIGMVSQIAERVIVMQGGHIIEVDTPKQIWENPQADYTRTLVNAIPIAHPALQAERREKRNKF